MRLVKESLKGSSFNTNSRNDTGTLRGRLWFQRAGAEEGKLYRSNGWTGGNDRQ